jgi:predicted NBD/HSP70 family sugar kinase
VALLEGGDPKLQRVVRGAGTLLGMLLQRLVVTINPEVLILGGPLSRLQGLVEEAMETLARLGGERPYHLAEVRVCRFGLDAAAVGAAASVLHDALHPTEALRPAAGPPAELL